MRRCTPIAAVCSLAMPILTLLGFSGPAAATDKKHDQAQIDACISKGQSDCKAKHQNDIPGYNECVADVTYACNHPLAPQVRGAGDLAPDSGKQPIGPKSGGGGNQAPQ